MSNGSWIAESLKTPLAAITQGPTRHRWDTLQRLAHVEICKSGITEPMQDEEEAQSETEPQSGLSMSVTQSGNAETQSECSKAKQKKNQKKKAARKVGHAHDSRGLLAGSVVHGSSYFQKLHERACPSAHLILYLKLH